MRIGDFSLEILVNNKILPEYQIPKDDNIMVPYSRVAVDRRESWLEECKITTYVAVPEPSCHFAIRAGIHTTKDPHLIKGIHVVDGKNDNTYMELNPANSEQYNYTYGFYNHNKSIFHLFKFDSTTWSDDNIFVSNLPRCIPSKVTKDKGSLGVISVYFYKAERLPEKRSSSKKYASKSQKMELPNSLNDFDFDPSDVIFIDNSQVESCPNLKITHDYPVAVLYIHYQTKEWIKNLYKSKELPIPKSLANDSFIKKDNKKVNEDFTMDDLLYGELTDVESESEQSSSNSGNEQEKCSTFSSNLIHKEIVTNIYKIRKKRKIIISSDDDNSLDDINDLILSNNDNKSETHNFKEVIADNDGFNNKNFSSDKNKKKSYSKEDQVGGKKLYNKAKNNIEIKANDKIIKANNKNFSVEVKNLTGNNIEAKANGKILKANNKNLNVKVKNLVENKSSNVKDNVICKNFGNIKTIENKKVEVNSKNLQVENKGINVEIDAVNKVNRKNLNVKVKFESMSLDDIVENISKEREIIIIDDEDDDEDDDEMIIDDEIMFISKTEFEGKKIREIIDLTMDSPKEIVEMSDDDVILL